MSGVYICFLPHTSFWTGFWVFLSNSYLLIWKHHIIKSLSVSVSLLQTPCKFELLILCSVFFYLSLPNGFNCSAFLPFVVNQVMVGFSCVQMVNQNTTVMFYWPQERKRIQTFNGYQVVSKILRIPMSFVVVLVSDCFPHGFLPSVPNCLLLSDLLFFSVRAPGKYHTTIYPYIHQTCNNRKSEDQVRSVVIPDVDPTDVPPNLNFSMAAGDFLEIYTEEGTCTKRLSMYLFSWQGACQTAAVPHEVTRSITATCRESYRPIPDFSCPCLCIHVWQKESLLESFKNITWGQHHTSYPVQDL